MDPVLLNLCVVVMVAFLTDTNRTVYETSPMGCAVTLILVLYPAHPVLVGIIAFLASVQHGEAWRERLEAARRHEHEASARRDADARRAQAAREAREKAERNAREERERAHRENAEREARAREEAARRRSRPEARSVPIKYWWLHLGVPETASVAEIKSAYRKLAKECHPDTPTPDAERFKTVTEAYEKAMEARKAA